jgi:hypothetical protein
MNIFCSKKVAVGELQKDDTISSVTQGEALKLRGNVEIQGPDGGITDGPKSFESRFN